MEQAAKKVSLCHFCGNNIFVEMTEWQKKRKETSFFKKMEEAYLLF